MERMSFEAIGFSRDRATEIRRIALDSAIANAHDALGMLGRRPLVRDQNDGVTIVIQALQCLHDSDARGRIQVAGWFIGKDDIRIGDKRSRNGDALLLTARELAAQKSCPIGQAHSCDGFRRPIVPLGHRNRRMIEERQQNVFLYGRPGKQIECLKHEAHACRANSGQIIIIERCRRRALKKIGTRRMTIQKAENMHERRFPGARRTHDRYELSAFDAQIDIEEYGCFDPVIAIRFTQGSRFDEWGCGYGHGRMVD